ncbi:uncharacterized protein [Dermacentor albipictus]|uniref:uncharacterized protein n=1 Tax=Dermacentor albipictus TaxID=60249 RepID=UPI0031FC6FAF
MAKSKRKKERDGDKQPAARGDPAGVPFSPQAAGQPSSPGGVQRGPAISSAAQAGFPYVCGSPPVIRAGHLVYSPPVVTSPRSPRSGPTSPGFHAGIPLIAEQLRQSQQAAKNRVIVTSVVVLAGVVLVVVIVWARLWRDDVMANREPPPVTTPRARTEGS